MNIILPDSLEFESVREVLCQIEDWNYVVPSLSSGSYEDYNHDYWLGSSSNVQFWFLAVVKSESENDYIDKDKDVVMVLTHPPKPDANTIGKILIKIYSALNRQGDLSKSRIEEMVLSESFPEYQPVSALMPDAPKHWLNLPCELTVGFSLSEGACIYRSLFTEYKRNTISEALQVLCSPRLDGILFHYTLIAREVTPLLLWDVDWPLLRRGKESASEREKIQGDLPWEYEPDRTLFEIYQYCRSSSIWIEQPYFGEPSVRLRVGGKTPEEAANNWYICASIIRKIRSDINFSIHHT